MYGGTHNLRVLLRLDSWAGAAYMRCCRPCRCTCCTSRAMITLKIQQSHSRAVSSNTRVKCSTAPHMLGSWSVNGMLLCTCTGQSVQRQSVQRQSVQRQMSLGCHTTFVTIIPVFQVTVILKHVFAPAEFEQEPTLKTDLEADMASECAKLGPVDKVFLPVTSTPVYLRTRQRSLCTNATPAIVSCLMHQ